MDNPGGIAWIITSSALVLFMTPGLALFYGGMVRAKNVLNMLMMSFSAMGVVSVIWVAIGYSLAFGSGGGGFIGDFGWFGLSGLEGEELLTAMFQLTFAIITPALISGAVAGRMKFKAWLMFITLWSILVYPFVTHWAWAGWIGEMGAIDFAGGLVVHINAGVAALAVVMVLGPRLGFPKTPFRPHSLPLTVIGTGILWFGWFGFNAGSALAADGVAINALISTQVGAGTGILGWFIAELMHDKQTPRRMTMLGAASGAVAGLVAITPAAGFVGPGAAIVFGLVAGYVCYHGVALKYKFNWDDSLDVIGIHMVGGIVGSVLLGLFADAGVNGVDGMFYGNGILLWYQIVAIVAVAAFSFVVSWLIAKVVDATVGLRVDADDEAKGLDLSLHEERGYVWGTITAERGDQ